MIDEGQARRAGVVVAVAALVAGLLTLGAPTASAGSINVARESQVRKMVSGWMPYWTPDASLASLEANADLFQDVVGFWHEAQGASTIADQLSDSTRADIVRAAHAKSVKVFAAVTDGTPARTMASILKDPTKRKTHVKALVSLAVSNNYDGIDLDYEKFAFSDGKQTWAKTRPAWVAFVKELSKALRAKGLLLSAAVPVMYDDNRSDGSGYWVYDYANIASSVDRLRIMTYDYSVSAPGAIAPIDWVRRVLDFAVTQVPSRKIQVGVPAYGRDWPTPTAGCPVDNKPIRSSLTSRQAEALAADKGITPTWDPLRAEKKFSYKKTYGGVTAGGKPVSCTVTRKVWFEESRAALAKAKLVAEYRLGGIAQWTIGGEDKAQWAKLRQYARSINKVSPRVELFAGDTVQGSAIKVRGTVQSRSGRPIAGERWRLFWRAKSATGWSESATGRTSANGTLSVKRTPKKTGHWKLWVGGSWKRFSAETAPNRTRVKPG